MAEPLKRAAESLELALDSVDDEVGKIKDQIPKLRKRLSHLKKQRTSIAKALQNLKPGNMKARSGPTVGEVITEALKSRPLTKQELIDAVVHKTGSKMGVAASVMNMAKSGSIEKIRIHDTIRYRLPVEERSA